MQHVRVSSGRVTRRRRPRGRRKISEPQIGGGLRAQTAEASPRARHRMSRASVTDGGGGGAGVGECGKIGG